MPKNTERFSDRVENYIRFRPGYPLAILTYLTGAIGFDQDAVVADVGSGTGISAEVFLKNGNKVYAVEPNTEMREAADRLLDKYDKYVSINGTSEATSLPDGCADLILAAQAFHWFDRDAFRKECRRIGSDGAHCLLIWNERKVESPFEKAYEDLLIQYANDYLQVDHRNIKPEKINLFFAPNPVMSKSFHNEQFFDYEGVLGRLLSSSYTPNEGTPNYEPMAAHLRKIFDEHQHGGQVSFSYDCKLFLGKV